MADDTTSQVRPIVTRAEARATGLKRYFTGKPCLRGHIAERRVCEARCVECTIYVSPDGVKRPVGHRITAHPGRVVDGKKLCPRCEVIKLVTEFHKCASKRNGVQPACIACARLYYTENAETISIKSKAYAAANKEFLSAQGAAYRKANPEAEKARHRRYYDENKDVLLAQGAEYYTANRPKYLAKRRQWRLDNPAQTKASTARWRADNRQAVAAHTRNYTTAKRKASVAWADQNAIAALYALALSLTAETGVKHNVDHLVPLLSPHVCGLHCEANLAVVTERENKSKANRYWPDMPACLDKRATALL